MAERPALFDLVTTEQQTATDPTISAWVDASAGSGKTHVLTRRVLRLLLQGTEPHKILCVTYTKAAAAQMQNRVFEVLSGWSVKPEAALLDDLFVLTGVRPSSRQIDAARSLFAHVLDAPGGLRIRTIHAFCESVLARFPIEAGIAPNAQPMDERTTSEIIEEVTADLFARATAGHDDPALAGAVAYLALEVREAGLLDLLAQLAARRGKLARLIGREGEKLAQARVRLTAALGLDPGDGEASIRAAASRDTAFDGPALQRAAKALAVGTKSDVARAAALGSWLGASPAIRARQFDEYVGIFFTQTGTPRARLWTKGVADAFPDTPAALDAEARRLDAVVSKMKAARLAEATGALLVVGAAMLRHYAEIKRDRALLDYDDLILKTRDLLAADTGPSWVLFKLDGGIDHILVDEAQDTNRDQWAIIGALVDEFYAGLGARETLRTLFAVGDEKQSIFGFQGAEPDAFGAVRTGFSKRAADGGQRWLNRSMDASFRSSWPVLQAVNAVFGQDAAQAGLLSSGRFPDHRPVYPDKPGLVEMWPLVVAADDDERDPWALPLAVRHHVSAEKLMAERIAGTIKAWLDTAAVLESGNRPIRPGDIMILVQRRDEFFTEMVATLKRADIPVAGADRMILTGELAIRDLIAAARFALLPEDDLNTAVVLKGPFVGLGEDALFALCHDRGRASVWQRLRTFGEAHGGAFAAARDVLAALLSVADRAPPYEFFAALLGPGGGRARIAARMGRETADPVDEFLALALAYERLHPPSLEGFLHWAETGALEIKRDLDQGGDAVRVLTVHGAKGLEAPIVFLPDTCHMPTHLLDDKLLWAGQDGDLLVWSRGSRRDDQVAAEARAAMRAARDGEYRRLLYVAMTRAADRLYIGGYQKKPDLRPGCWYDLIRRGLRGTTPGAATAEAEVLRIDNRRDLRRRGHGSAASAAAKPDAATAPVLPAWATQPAAAEPVRRRLSPSGLIGGGHGDAAAGKKSSVDPPVLSPLAPGRARPVYRRGMLVHRLLQTLPDLAPSRRRAAALRYLGRPRESLDDAAIGAIADEVLAVIDDPAFKPLFGPSSRAEVPIVGRFGGVDVVGQVDRLVAGDDILVVDYKTLRPAPENLADVPPLYLGQMALYREVLRRVYPGRAVRAALIWTDGPRALWLPDDALDRALRAVAPAPA